MDGIGLETIVALLIALAATWPVLRQLSASPVRHRFGRFAAKRLCMVIGYVATVLVLTAALPAALYAVAIIAGILMLFERWRSRPSYGRSRGLPPGSLGLMPDGPLCDRSYYRKQFGRFGPVFKMNELLHPCVCVLGHQRGLRLLREHDDSLRAAPLPFNRHVPEGFLRFLDPARHTHYRRMIQPAISAQVIERAKPHITAEARRALDRMAEACGSCEARTTDPDPHLRDMVLAILARVFFGVERGGPDLEWLKLRFEAIDIRRFRVWGDGKRRSATTELMAFLARRVAASPAGRSDGQARSFLEALAAASPEAAENPTVQGNLIYMVESGRIDTADLLRWLIKMLAEHPEWIERVRVESGSRAVVSDGGKCAAERVVLETLRLAQSELLHRRTTREIWFDGYRIPKDWAIRICIQEGHRDPEVFADPDEFDPDRFLDRDYPRLQYAPFGLFRHTCVGAQLVHAISVAFVTELARRFDPPSVADWPVENSNFHWEPRRGHRIELRVRNDDPALV